MLEPRLSLRQLQVFVAIARSGGIGAAARRLGLAQATVSEALSELEAQLARQLFDRTGRRLALSGDGRALLPEALQIVDRVASLARGVNARATLHMGASVTAGNYVLPPVLASFLRERPDVDVSVSIRNTSEMIAAMRSMHADIAVVEGAVSDPDLIAAPWKRDDLVLIVSADNPLAGKQAKPADLAACAWVLRERGAGTRETFDLAIAPHFTPTRVVLEVGGNELLKHAVTAGFGVGCISAAAVASEVARGDLAIVSATWLNLSRVLSLVLHKHKYVDPGILAFMRHCEGWGDFPVDRLLLSSAESARRSARRPVP